MLGSILFLLQRFLQQELGTELWNRLFAEAGLAARMYLPESNYPDDDAIGLLQAAGRMTGRPVPELIETFGYSIAPDLLGLFRSLVRPHWKTLDLLENVETMHTAMRNRNPLADPPVIQCLRLAETELQLTYNSSRRLCTLAKGTIRGIAAHYGEEVKIVEQSCMHHGYPFCSFQIVVVSRLSSPTIDPEATQPRPAAGGTAAGKVHNPWAVLTPSPARLTEVATSKTGDMPSRIMQYRLLRQIGAGGMGVVYLAEDGMLGRQVAIKLMLPTVAAVPEHQDRFLREARAMAALSNDHIVTIHQVGRHADRPFIVMPRLHGRTLEQDLGERGAPPYPEVFRIGREIAIGLHAAHEAGLVHRDIKPSNLWLEDPGRRVKILDFGMARSDARDGHLTQPGVRIGTPLYMSPEQAAGNPVDARSDLYSLGVVLYRMCAGRTPFQGDSNLALLRSIAVDAPQPLAELVPTIPPGLAETIMRLLAKNPADRPDSAIAAAEALEHLPVAGGETPSNFPCLQARPARRRRRQH